MKRILITAIIILLMFNLAQAQREQNNTQQLNFGFMAGYTVSILKGADVASISNGGTPGSISGFSLSAYTEIQLAHHFGLRQELSIVQKGATLKLEGQNDKIFESKYKNSYVDIAPVHLSFNANGFQFLAGPFLSVLISSSVQLQDESGKLYTDKNIYGTASSMGDYTQKVDVGLLAGIGYTFRNGFNVAGRYAHGLNAVIEHTERSDNQWKIYNRGITISLGYMFF